METTDRSVIRSLAGLAIVGQVVFVAGWLILGAVEGHGYSPFRHDVSDLGALTAHHAGLWAVVLGVSGVLTIAFAVRALRPVLGVAAGLVALSLPAIDNLGDVFFRLDCRAADAGCSMSRATTSWHGKAHILVFIAAALCTIAAPFVLAARMRTIDGWQDRARPARRFGVGVIAVLAGALVLGDSSVAGLMQRVAIVYVVSGVVVLAVWVARVGTARPADYSNSSGVQAPVA